MSYERDRDAVARQRRIDEQWRRWEDYRAWAFRRPLRQRVQRIVWAPILMFVAMYAVTGSRLTDPTPALIASGVLALMMLVAGVMQYICALPVLQPNQGPPDWRGVLTWLVSLTFVAICIALTVMLFRAEKIWER
jgi:hypothetical protein